MKKPKKPLIITIISVAVVAVVAAGIFFYPCIVPRKIGSIVGDGFSDVVKIEFTGNHDFRIKSETTNPHEIEHVIDLISDIEMKKDIDQGFRVGIALSMSFIKENGEKTYISIGGGDPQVNGTRYKFSSDDNYLNSIRNQITERYHLDQLPSEYGDQQVPREVFYYGGYVPSEAE